MLKSNIKKSHIHPFACIFGGFRIRIDTFKLFKINSSICILVCNYMLKSNRGWITMQNIVLSVFLDNIIIVLKIPYFSRHINEINIIKTTICLYFYNTLISRYHDCAERSFTFFVRYRK